MKMDLGRKIRIGIGALLLLISYLNGDQLYFAGFFLIASGVFNLCPVCTTCSDGSCEIEPEKKK